MKITSVGVLKKLPKGTVLKTESGQEVKFHKCDGSGRVWLQVPGRRNQIIPSAKAWIKEAEPVVVSVPSGG